MEAVQRRMKELKLHLYELAVLVDVQETKLRRMFKGAIKSVPGDAEIIASLARVLSLDPETIRAELEEQKRAWRVGIALAA